MFIRFFSVALLIVFFLISSPTLAQEQCLQSTLTENATYQNYYWAIVVDYPPKDGHPFYGGYSKSCNAVPGTWTECDYTIGWERSCTIIDDCPGSHDIEAYLLASINYLGNQSDEPDGCNGLLRSKSLNPEGKVDIFSDVYYQVNVDNILIRYIDDPGDIYECELNDGRMAYSIDTYSISTEGSLARVNWVQVPVNSPEIAEIYLRLYAPFGTIALAFKATNFTGGEYGVVYSNDNYTLVTWGAMSGLHDMHYQDESVSCYCLDLCDEYNPPYCLDVVQIVEDYEKENRKVIFSGGLSVPFTLEWPY